MLRWLWLCLIVPGQIFAQLPFLQTSITEADGLLSNYVQDVCMDNQQRLWIATDKGVSVFNGYDFVSITTRNGLDNSYVNQLLFHKATGRMLLATASASCYVYANGRLQQLTKGSILNPNSLTILSDGTLQVLARTGPDSAAILHFTDPGVRPPDTVAKLPALHAPCLAGERWLQVKWQCKGMPAEIRWLSGHFAAGLPAEKGRLAYTDSLQTVYVVGNQDTIEWNYRGANHVVERSAEMQHYWYLLTAFRWQNEPVLLAWAYNAPSLAIVKRNGAIRYFSKEETGLPAITKVIPVNHRTVALATTGEGLKALHMGQAEWMLQNQAIRRVAAGSDGAWVATKTGLEQVNTSSGQWRTVIAGLNQPTSMTEEKGRLHVTDFQGYRRYRKMATGKWQQEFAIANGSGVSGYASLGDGHFLLSNYSTGVGKYDATGQIKEQWQVQNGYLHDNIVERMMALPNGMAFSSYSSGLRINYHDGKHALWDTLHGLRSNTIYDVGYWQGLLHIGTEGYWQYVHNQRTHIFGAAEGFEGKRAMYSFADARGRIFVLSDKVLMLKQGDRLQALHSQPIVPSTSASVMHAWYDTTSQNLWCATTQGLLKIYVPAVGPDSLLLHPVLAWAPNAAGKQWQGNAGDSWSCRLLLDQIDYTGASSIYYQLNGYQSQWIKADPGDTLRFNKLPAGQYQLLAFAVNPDGLRDEVSALYQFTILAPWYTRWYMVMGYVAGLVLLVWLAIRKVSNLRVKRRLEKFAMEQKLQDERNRISNELHDNVGSQLTNMIAQLDYVEGALQFNKHETALQKVEALQQKARATMTQLRESIWALKAEHIGLRQFVLKLQQYMVDVFDPDTSGMVLHLGPIPATDHELSPSEAVHLLRLMQEACQNIQKHASATEVKLMVTCSPVELRIRLDDNGVGIKEDMIKGQGMGTMQHRAAAVGATCLVSNNGQGTTLTINLPLLPKLP